MAGRIRGVGSRRVDGFLHVQGQKGDGRAGDILARSGIEKRIYWVQTLTFPSNWGKVRAQFT